MKRFICCTKTSLGYHEHLRYGTDFFLRMGRICWGDWDRMGCSISFFTYILNFFNIYLFFIFIINYICSLGQGDVCGSKGGRSGSTSLSSQSSPWQYFHGCLLRRSRHGKPHAEAPLECVRLPSIAFLVRVRVECGSSVAALGPVPAARFKRFPAKITRERAIEKMPDDSNNNNYD